MTVRYRQCRSCYNNLLEGFTGKPECTLQVEPDDEGRCDRFATGPAEVVLEPVKVQVERLAVVDALGILETVASQTRFNGRKPIELTFGRGHLLLRANNGSTDIAVELSCQGPDNAEARVVVPLDGVRALVADGNRKSVTLALSPEGVKAKELVAAITSPMTLFERAHVGPPAGVDEGAPVLSADVLRKTFLLSALGTGGAARYVHLEYPSLTFYTTDSRRMHISGSPPADAGQNATICPMTKEQFAALDCLFQEWPRAELRLGVPVVKLLEQEAGSKTLLVAGWNEQRGIMVHVACQLPNERGINFRHVLATVEGQNVHRWTCSVALLRAVDGEDCIVRFHPAEAHGRPYVVGEVLDKDGKPIEGVEPIRSPELERPLPFAYALRLSQITAALVTMESRQNVEFLAVDPTRPAKIVMPGRQAVLMPVVVKEVPKPVEQVPSQQPAQERRRVMSVRQDTGIVTAAVGQQTAAVAYPIGSRVASPNGEMEVLATKVTYKIKLPNGKCRWFNAGAIRSLAAGEIVNEAAEEAV